MNPVANADAFALAYRQIQGQYEALFKDRIATVRAKFGAELAGDERAAAQDLLAELLEAHARAYVVNGVLAALNWRMGSEPEDGLPDLVPEAPVRSLATGHIRFLDYLGLERKTDSPLLIVETKHPSSELPTVAGKTKKAKSDAEVIALGLSDEKLSGDWKKWLSDMRDYVRSVFAKAKEYPKRVVITNGGWVVVFRDPEDAFAEGGSHDATKISVFKDASEILANVGSFFTMLAHRFVLGQSAALTPGRVPFEIKPAHVRGIMHGLRLRYSEQRQVWEVQPTISVAPVLLVRLSNESWIRVEHPPKAFLIPHDGAKLEGHLQEVDQAAKELRGGITASLGQDFKCFTIDEHYSDATAFNAMNGVTSEDLDRFVIATGMHTHFVLLTPSVPNCPYHDWSAGNRDGVAAEPMLLIRSTDPRAFFVSPENHHCAHRTVLDAKASAITEANRDQCGPRSGSDGYAFCEIYRIDTRVCCRTCAFETVCTKADVFKVLPCKRPEVPPNAAVQ